MDERKETDVAVEEAQRQHVCIEYEEARLGYWGGNVAMLPHLEDGEWMNRAAETLPVGWRGLLLLVTRRADKTVVSVDIYQAHHLEDFAPLSPLSISARLLISQRLTDIRSDIIISNRGYDAIELVIEETCNDGEVAEALWVMSLTPDEPDALLGIWAVANAPFTRLEALITLLADGGKLVAPSPQQTEA